MTLHDILYDPEGQKSQMQSSAGGCLLQDTNTRKNLPLRHQVTPADLIIIPCRTSFSPSCYNSISGPDVIKASCQRKMSNIILPK